MPTSVQYIAYATPVRKYSAHRLAIPKKKPTTGIWDNLCRVEITEQIIRVEITEQIITSHSN